MSREAMKLALEAMMYADACLKKQLTTKDKHKYAQDLLLEAGAALKQALEQPEPEPVAWAKFSQKGNIVDLLSEPDHEYVPLYTSPPKREPLTDEQMEQIHQQYGGNIKKIMRAVEAAHGIKGEA